MRANIISGIAETIGKFVESLVALFMGLLLVVVACNVFARYILKIGLTWAEEFSLLLFIWVVFLGAYLAMRKKAHLALTFIIKRLPPNAFTISRHIILVLVMVFVLAVFVGGLEFVRRVVSLDQRTPLLRISAAWAYASIPVSMGLMLLELMRMLIRGEHIVRFDIEN